jgi:hypothetical protein
MADAQIERDRAIAGFFAALTSLAGQAGQLLDYELEALKESR